MYEVNNDLRNAMSLAVERERNMIRDRLEFTSHLMTEGLINYYREWLINSYRESEHKNVNWFKYGF